MSHQFKEPPLRGSNNINTNHLDLLSIINNFFTSFLHCPPIGVLYFIRFSVKEPNDEFILLPWHHKTLLVLLSDVDPPESGLCPTLGPQPGPALWHSLARAPPKASRWAVPPYKPPLQTECRPFCPSTLQFLSDVSQQTAE